MSGRGLCWGVLLLVAVSCSAPPPPPRPPAIASPAAAPEPAAPAAPPPPTTPSDRELLRRLDLKLGTQGDIAVPDALSHDQRRELYRAFVRDRMKQPAFYESTFRALRLIRGPGESPGVLPPLPFTLKKSDSTPAVYYLEQPCKAKDQIDVEPWWDLGSKVRVCADSYRPEVVSYVAGGESTVWCDSTFYKAHRAWVTSPCKCGRNLMNCAPSSDVQRAIMKGFSDEQALTVQHVVEHHLPFGEILTLPESVRSGYGDLFYARSEFIATGRWSYPKPESIAASLRPRPAAFDAGILSTWFWMIDSDSHRVMAREIWDQFLCHPLASRNVTPAEILRAMGGSTTAVGKFRDSVRMEFTTAPGCENCHKILENASRAMVGYTLMQYGGHYIKDHAYTGTIQFFVGDVSSPRAEGPATLHWLGATIAAQPEFNACMVKKVLSYVYDGFEYAPALAERLQARFSTGQDFATLFEDAVVSRYLGPGSLEPGHSEPRSSEPRSPGPRSPGPRSPEPRSPEPRSPGR